MKCFFPIGSDSPDCRVINKIPLFLDYNDPNEFYKISDDEFNNDFENLINIVKSINKNIKLIFISHIISYNNQIIPEREYILNLLKNNSKKYDNCYVLCPNDYITNNDLEDARHYKPESRIKILNAIKDIIIDIEEKK
jgi:hypothetical protein